MASGSGQVKTPLATPSSTTPRRMSCHWWSSRLRTLRMCGVALRHRPGVDPDPPARRAAGRAVQPQHPAQPLHRVVRRWPPSPAGAGRAPRRARRPRRPGRPWCRSGRRPGPGSRRAPPPRRRPGWTRAPAGRAARPSSRGSPPGAPPPTVWPCGSPAHAALGRHGAQHRSESTSDRRPRPRTARGPRAGADAPGRGLHLRGRCSAWERRHLYAGAWTCLGRVADLFPPEGGLTQRAVVVGDVSCLRRAGQRRAPDVREHLPAPRPRAAAPRTVRRPSGPSCAPTTRGPTT